jgi:phage-related minor tail protein
MTIMQFVLLAFALLAAALVGYLIPVLIQLKKTLSSVDRLVEESEKELLPLLRDLGETASHVRHIATQADEAVKNLGSATSSIRGAAEKIGLLGQVLEKQVIPRVAVISALAFGIKKGMEFLRKRKKESHE